MLRRILAITGKPGLYRLISQGNRAIIVEDIESGRRFPALQRDKIIGLGDIAMYTDSEEKPLGEVLDKVYEYMKGEPVDLASVTRDKSFKTEFGKILEDFDRDRVHDSDIKKLFSWYNILLKSGMIKFTAEEEAEKEPEEGK